MICNEVLVANQFCAKCSKTNQELKFYWVEYHQWNDFTDIPRFLCVIDYPTSF